VDVDGTKHVCPSSHCHCRDILTIPETRADWWELYQRHLQPRVDAGSLKLSLINSDHLLQGGEGGGGDGDS